MPDYGTWYPCAGTEAVIPGIILLAIAGLLARLGTRMKVPLKAERPGRTIGIFLVLIWALSIVTFLVAVLAYAPSCTGRT